MSINRGVDKGAVVHIYNGILLSHKREWNKDISSNMDGHRNYHVKLGSEAQISYAITYMWYLKKGYDELLWRRETDSQTFKNLGLPKETGWGEWAGGLRWKCKIELWWWLYNYEYNRIHWVKKKKIGMSGWQKHWMGAHLIIPGIVSLSYLPAATSLLLHSTSQSQRKKWPLLSERKAFWVHGLQLVLMHLGLSTLNTHPEGANHFSVLHTRSRFKGGKKKKQTHTHSHTHSHMQKKIPRNSPTSWGGQLFLPAAVRCLEFVTGDNPGAFPLKNSLSALLSLWTQVIASTLWWESWPFHPSSSIRKCSLLNIMTPESQSGSLGKAVWGGGSKGLPRKASRSLQMKPTKYVVWLRLCGH